MKSAGVKRARADLAKCGLAERKFSGPECTLVKLQRPPPEIRIFLPGRSERSITPTRRPRLPAVAAQNRPAAPAPRTRTSNRPLMWNRYCLRFRLGGSPSLRRFLTENVGRRKLRGERNRD